MTDDRKTPPRTPRPPTPRPGSERERDRDVRRELPTPRGVGLTQAPQSPFPAEEITGNYTGEELRERRAGRPTEERFERLEDNHDELRADVKAQGAKVDSLTSHVGNLRQDVGEMSGKLEILPKLVDAIDRAADRAATREQTTYTQQVRVETAGKVAEIEIDKISKTTGIKDDAHARKMRRKIIAAIVAGVVTVFSSGVFVHWLLGKLGSTSP